MESETKKNMIYIDEQSKETCEWLLNHGLTLKECALFIAYRETSTPFAVALLKILEKRNLKLEKSDENYNLYDYGNPTTP